MKRLGGILLWVFAALGALVSLAVVVGVFARKPLAEWALRHALAGSGLELRGLEVRELGLRQATLSSVDLAWKGQTLKVDTLCIDRRAAETFSLGQVRLSGVRVALDADALVRELKATAEKPKAQAAEAPLPAFKSLQVEGGLAVGTGILPFVVTLAPGDKPGVLGGRVELKGEAVSGTVWVHYASREAVLAVETPGLLLSLSELRRIADQFGAPLLPDWEFSGRLRVSGAWSSASRFEAEPLQVALLDLRVAKADQSLLAEGIEGSLRLTDPVNLVSAPGQELRVRHVRSGQQEADGVLMRLQILGTDRLRIEALKLSVFGGQVEAGGFEFQPSDPALSTRLRLTGIDLEAMLKLFPMEGTKATGRADGEVPVRYGKNGFQFGAGWLAMSPGSTATLRLEQPGLLTSGLSPSSLSYPTLKAIEDGILNLRVKEMRAELFDVSDPEARSAVLHVIGEPLDPNVKAPISLDVNVNGPLSALINWSLDSRVGLKVGH